MTKTQHRTIGGKKVNVQWEEDVFPIKKYKEPKTVRAKQIEFIVKKGRKRK